MIPSNPARVPAELPQEGHASADCGDPGPMPQQGGSHGHEMHPQKLVRLVGCHDAGKHEVVRRPH